MTSVTLQFDYTRDVGGTALRLEERGKPLDAFAGVAHYALNGGKVYAVCLADIEHIPVLCRENSPQRRHDLRRVFNGVRCAARTGGQRRYLPHEYGPWWAVYQQMQRWLDAGVFEALLADVQEVTGSSVELA